MQCPKRGGKVGVENGKDMEIGVGLGNGGRLPFVALAQNPSPSVEYKGRGKKGREEREGEKPVGGKAPEESQAPMAEGKTGTGNRKQAIHVPNYRARPANLGRGGLVSTTKVASAFLPG